MPLWESTAIRIELSDILLIEVVVGLSWHKRCQRFSCYPSHGVLHSTCRIADLWVSFYIFYHGQDDFALVLMEDAEGEVLSLTEEYPSNDHFQAWICVCDSSVTNCKPLAFQFGQLGVTKCTHV